VRAEKEEAPGGEAPQVGITPQIPFWFFIFADCLNSRSFVCLFLQFLLQQTLTKLVFLGLWFPEYGSAASDYIGCFFQ
jgi:hypothetical protein